MWKNTKNAITLKKFREINSLLKKVTYFHGIFVQGFLTTVIVQMSVKPYLSSLNSNFRTSVLSIWFSQFRASLFLKHCTFHCRFHDFCKKVVWVWRRFPQFSTDLVLDMWVIYSFIHSSFLKALKNEKYAVVVQKLIVKLTKVII